MSLEEATVSNMWEIAAIVELLERKGLCTKHNLYDIITGTAEQLKALSSIGDAYTEKIIKGRPYSRKDELVQKKILPQATYGGIKGKIVAKQK
jgi:hypothetical protein